MSRLSVSPEASLSFLYFPSGLQAPQVSAGVVWSGAQPFFHGTCVGPGSWVAGPALPNPTMCASRFRALSYPFRQHVSQLLPR